ncbi:MAG TPA: hypothetical protein ENN77_02000 [Candidatus Wirthbacteria bacterium]|nr:hypothetical protein [Candidatus Wirthbacteria bacterium]
MTDLNKQNGRYIQERQVVFERHNSFPNTWPLPAMTTRPALNKKYFRRLELSDQLSFDEYLEKIIRQTSDDYQAYLVT